MDPHAVILEVAQLRRDQFIEREPARVFEFVVRTCVAGRSVRVESDHQRPGKRPRLRGPIAGTRHTHAGLLQHLARHGLLEGFTRLHETRDQGPAPRRPRRLAPQQEPRTIADGGDDGDIGAGVMLARALRATAHPAGPFKHHRAATETAEPRARLPRLQGTCTRECRSGSRRPVRRCRAQVDAMVVLLGPGIRPAREPATPVVVAP